MSIMEGHVNNGYCCGVMSIMEGTILDTVGWGNGNTLFLTVI